MWNSSCKALMKAICIVSVVSACQSNGDTTAKNVDGGTISLTQEREIADFEINVPNFLTSINKVTSRSVNGGRQVVEKYFVGSSYVALAQHARFGGYRAATSGGYFYKDTFLDDIKRSKFFKSNLVGAAIEKYEWGGDVALYAHKGNCYWLRLAKVLEPEGVNAAIDTIAEIVSCRPLSKTPKQILQEFGFADATDRSEYLHRTRSGGDSTANGTKKASKNHRPFAAIWEGFSNPVSGFVEISGGKIGKVSLTLPEGGGACTGKFEGKSKYKGIWFVKCSNGLTASGAYTAHGSGKGATGEGFDSEGRKIKYTISGS